MVRAAAGVALLAALLGLTFSANSSLDYAAHLDRQVHDLHCSLVPGAAVTAEAGVCREAMYSPYSALFKRELWGGIPIALFSLGAFCFFAGGALLLLVQGASARPWLRRSYAGLALSPALVSAGMFYVSMSELGGLCLTCVGIYLSSLLLLLAAIVLFRATPFSSSPSAASLQSPAAAGATGGWLPVALRASALCIGLGLFTLAPALVYAKTAPDHSPYLADCGALKQAPTPADSLLNVAGPTPLRPAVFIEDPLCPTCRGLHARLKAEDVLTRLDARLVLMPLDSECNWMLAEPMHPGACQVSRAILCVEDTRAALDWAFEKQKELAEAGRLGEKALDQRIVETWGPAVLACTRGAEAKRKLNRHLHFAAENNVPISTPQIYLDDKRLCDEDTDLGLSFALSRLAPEVLP